MVNTGRTLQPKLVYNLRISAFFTIALNAAIKKKYNIISQKNTANVISNAVCTAEDIGGLCI